MCSPLCPLQKHIVRRGGSVAALGVAAVVSFGGRTPAFPQEPAASNKREIPAVRLTAPPVIDGDLSDPAWQQAARADRFTDELYGNPVQDQTEIHLSYDERNIYVAFHAFDSQPAAIVARETKRGTPFSGEDTLTFTIDPFHTHKASDRSSFTVNPLGTQFAQLGEGRATKLEWEGKWKAAARIVADGWTAEMAIPWSILNYPAAKRPTTIGINFDRRQERTKIHSWWSNVGAQGFFDLDGHWVGVQLPAFRPQLSLLPYASPGWVQNSGTGFRSGLDLRSRLTPTLTAVGTVNPDFQNVQEAVEGIDFSYGERFVPDSRPFFQEGANIYDVGGIFGNFFYSRRIPGFSLGENVYGKVTDRNTIGVLSALDPGHTADWVVRGLHEFGATSSVGLALLNRDDAQLTNRVLVLGGDVRRGLWGVNGNWAGAWRSGSNSGGAGIARILYQSPRWFAEVAPNFIGPDFHDELGYVPFTDFKGVISNLGYSTQWRRGPVRSLFTQFNTNDSHRYDGRLFRQERTVFTEVQSRSDYSVDLSWDGGRFEQFDDSVYSLVLRARASDPFHNFGFGYSWGRRAGAPYKFLTPSATWRFGHKLTLGLASSLLFHIQDAQQHIFTFNYDFSPQQGIAGRLVAQTGGTNGYFAYRHSGYGGTETFLILGDPNAARFRKRIVLKVVWAM